MQTYIVVDLSVIDTAKVKLEALINNGINDKHIHVVTTEEFAKLREERAKHTLLSINEASTIEGKSLKYAMDKKSKGEKKLQRSEWNRASKGYRK